MVQTRRTLLTALPVAFLAPGAQATRPEVATSQPPAETGLSQLAEELNELARQAVKREIPASEVARRGASGMRLLRSQLESSGVQARLQRQIRSPRSRASALAMAGAHLDANDQFTELGLTPPPAPSREELEKVMERWAANPRWLAQSLTDIAGALDRAAPRLFGATVPGGRIVTVQYFECEYLRSQLGLLQWFMGLTCLFAMMDPALMPGCWSVTALYLSLQVVLWAMPC